MTPINGEKIAEQINKNRYVAASALLLGLAFTISAIVKHHYDIKLTKIRIRKESQES